MNLLQTIMAERRAAVAAARQIVPPELLRELAAGRAHHSLVKSLRRGGGVRIIAEVKKASPSAGVLQEQYRPAELAAAYARAGAAGISVLTEPLHFLGSGEHLRAVRRAVGLPVLRKDFICDPYQLAEAAAWGADVVLLILAALDKGQAQELYAEACGLHLEVLAEAHTEEEVLQALDMEKAIVGVNSRNLRTLRTDLDTVRRLAACLPAERTAVAESGIRRPGEIRELEALGYQGFLVGHTLVASSDPAAALRRLRCARQGAVRS